MKKNIKAIFGDGPVRKYVIGISSLLFATVAYTEPKKIESFQKEFIIFKMSSVLKNSNNDYVLICRPESTLLKVP